MRVSALAFLAAALTITACGGSGDAGDDLIDETTTQSEVSTDSTAAEGDDGGNEADSEGVENAEEQDAIPVVFPVIATEPVEPGPRPLLAWEAVAGAASYELMVLDSNNVAYWAWSGDSTEIHLGGMSNPEAVGAWAFEPLTWVVTARDDAGRTLALSERADIQP